MELRTTVRGASVQAIRNELESTYGPGSKILRVEKVTQGGISGFMAKHFFEATVLLPGHPGTHPDTGMNLGSRLGIAALLAGANDVEDSWSGATSPEFSTGSAGFGALMDELSSRNIATIAEPVTGPAPVASEPAGPAGPAPLVPASFTARVAIAAPTSVPGPLTRPGDLVLLVGLGQDPLAVAQSMSRQLGSVDIRGGGLIKARGVDSLTDRRGALLARASSVGEGTSTICAYGLDLGTDSFDVLEAINADQVWVVVDAARKAEDTSRWVGAIAARLNVAAVAVVNTRFTASPQTVNNLAIPVGWVDGAPAPSTQL